MTGLLSFKKEGGLFLSSIVLLLAVSACNQVDDDRIPSLPVYINLSGPGMWNSYGVAGVGLSREFINFEGVRSPSGFPYNANTYVGFGEFCWLAGWILSPRSPMFRLPMTFHVRWNAVRRCGFTLIPTIWMRSVRNAVHIMT